MRKKKILRMTSATYEALRKEFTGDNSDDEQFALGVCSEAVGETATIYLVKEVLFPDLEDLASQGPAGVGPNRPYQTAAYQAATEQDLHVIDFHTHPFQRDSVGFSGIDDHQGDRNAAFVREHFPPESTMLMVVFNKSLDRFHGRVLDRETGQFHEIDCIEVLGKSIDFISRLPEKSSPADERYARHLLVPGWRQSKLGRLKVVLVGLGGNGAQILQGLLSLGVGNDGGWIVACDPDVIEPSNLPRIPYATPADVGKSKAHVSQRYADRRSPGCESHFFACGVEDPEMKPRLAEAHVVIGAVDRDRIRANLNRSVIRNLTGYVDSAAEVIPQEGECQAAGQVRVIEPGATSCLVCGGDLDLSVVDPATLSEEEREAQRQVGYVRGLEETPTPAVADLNGVASYLTLSHLRRMVFGEPLDGREYLFYDRQNCSILSASRPEPDPNCPVCGLKGELGLGDRTAHKAMKGRGAESSFRMEAGETVAAEEPVANDLEHRNAEQPELEAEKSAGQGESPLEPKQRKKRSRKAKVAKPAATVDDAA